VTRAGRRAALTAAVGAAALLACGRDGNCHADVCTTGTVQHAGAAADSAPGTWAVRGDDGVTYAVVPALPVTFRRPGLRVKMTAKKHAGRAASRAAGGARPVELLRIETM
jgi:hypothetical protein